MSLVPRVVVRRWLEVMLAVVSIAMLYLNAYPQSMPRALDLSNDANLSLGDWVFRGMAFGLLGIWGFSGLVVLFFLLYSPIYLVNKIPHLVGKGGWLDKREVRFYLACFALVCLLVTLFAHSVDGAAILFVVLAGFGPLVWRLLV